MNFALAGPVPWMSVQAANTFVVHHVKVSLGAARVGPWQIDSMRTYFETWNARDFVEVLAMAADGGDVITWFHMHVAGKAPVAVANWAQG